MILKGKVVSGAGEGAYFTQIDWVLRQCDEKLGFRPHPGTLNLEISGPSLAIVEALDQEKGIELISPDPKFCNARVFPVRIGKIAGAVILPEKKVRIHPEDIVEIIAPVNLKASLHIQEGDILAVAFVNYQT